MPKLLRHMCTPLALIVALLAPSGAHATVPPLDGTDAAEATLLESKIADHMYFGQVYETFYGSPDKNAGDVAGIGGQGDSALWTGTYLAAESFRYSVAKSKLALTPGDPEWTAARDEAKARIDKMVAQYHILINISKNWNEELSPSTSPPGFGGGVFHGEPGLLFRACIPTDAPANETWGVRGSRVYGPLAWDDGKTYWCEDGTSRDAYAGTTFGLITAFDLVSGDDPAMRAQIRSDVLAMTTFAFKYYWSTPRPHGNIALPPLGNDLDNFISPLFVYVPMARLNMAQIARHVADVAGSADEKTKWDAVWLEELATQLPILALSMEVDAADPYAGYYKFNLHHLTAFNVTRLETDPTVRLLEKQAVGVMDRTTGDDINAHFETITYAMTGEPARLDAALTHLREWRTYRARQDVATAVRNSTRCGADITCVQSDQHTITQSTPAGDETITIPGTSGNRASAPLAVADRPGSDFIWQRPPTELDGGWSPTYESPGIDYLLPYWMIRYETEVTPPALDPFLPWPGPTHH